MDELAGDAELAAALVRAAGRLAARMRANGLAAERKTSITDLVSAADRAAEALVAERLRAARPGDGVLGEEGTSEPGEWRVNPPSGELQVATRRGKSPLGEGVAARGTGPRRTWVVDPVDGTYNFLAGLPIWCSALALVSGGRPDRGPASGLHGRLDGSAGGGPDGGAGGVLDGEPESGLRGGLDGEPASGAAHGPASFGVTLLGAVYQPVTDELWLGGPGRPTTLNGRPVAALDPGRPLAELSLASYLHPPRLAEDATRAAWLRALGGAATVRTLGSGSVELAAVASGRLGAWLQLDCPPWDWLPGAALVRAAGGATEVLAVHGHRWHVAGPTRAVAELADRVTGPA